MKSVSDTLGVMSRVCLFVDCHAVSSTCIAIRGGSDVYSWGVSITFIYVQVYNPLMGQIVLRIGLDTLDGLDRGRGGAVEHVQQSIHKSDSN